MKEYRPSEILCQLHTVRSKLDRLQRSTLKETTSARFPLDESKKEIARLCYCIEDIAGKIAQEKGLK